MKTLSFDLVRTSGKIDLQLSLDSAEAALVKHIAEKETEEATIAKAVHAVFDATPGANITMPAIEGMVSRHLNCVPSNYKTLTQLALTYVRDNAGTRESGALFTIQKGKGKGVQRWADVKVEAPKPGTTPSAPATEAPEADESDDTASAE